MRCKSNMDLPRLRARLAALEQKTLSAEAHLRKICANKALGVLGPACEPKAVETFLPRTERQLEEKAGARREPCTTKGVQATSCGSSGPSLLVSSTKLTSPSSSTRSTAYVRKRGSWRPDQDGAMIAYESKGRIQMHSPITWSSEHKAAIRAVSTQWTKDARKFKFPKRYQCPVPGCKKLFTSTRHAGRHSRIRSAPSISCPYEGCHRCHDEGSIPNDVQEISSACVRCLLLS